MLDPEQYSDAASGAKVAESELKETLEGLAEHLFGQGIEVTPHHCFGSQRMTLSQCQSLGCLGTYCASCLGLSKPVLHADQMGGCLFPFYGPIL